MNPFTIYFDSFKRGTFIFRWSNVISWTFNVINTHNQFVRTIGRALEQLVEPALRRIRRYVPPFGNMDISAVILFLIILFIQLVISRLIGNLV